MSVSECYRNEASQNTEHGVSVSLLSHQSVGPDLLMQVMFSTHCLPLLPVRHLLFILCTWDQVKLKYPGALEKALTQSCFHILQNKI